MARRRSGQPRPLRELLGDLGDRADLRYGRRRLQASDIIRRVLADVLGADAATRCRPGPISGTEATLECRTNATAQRVQLLAADLLRQVRQVAGNDDVQSLRVTVDVEGWDTPES